MTHHKKNNGKNEVSLRDYVDIRFADIEKATTLAGDNLKTRLESLNEWRLQNKDEREVYVTRSVFDAKFDALEKDKRANTSMIISLLALIVGIASIIIRVI